MKSQGRNAVATYRRVANMTQRELGRAVGRSGLWVSEVEREVRQPSRAEAEKLARALGLDLDVIPHRDGGAHD